VGDSLAPPNHWDDRPGMHSRAASPNSQRCEDDDTTLSARIAYAASGHKCCYSVFGAKLLAFATMFQDLKHGTIGHGHSGHPSFCTVYYAWPSVGLGFMPRMQLSTRPSMSPWSSPTAPFRYITPACSLTMRIRAVLHLHPNLVYVKVDGMKSPIGYEENNLVVTKYFFIVFPN
jgi:hypothetical protein